MKHPRWCLKFISPNELHRVVQAVRDAETKTTGEIIPMIVRRSSPLGHLGLLIFLLTTLLLISAAFFVDHMFDVEIPFWISILVIVIFWPLSEWLARLASVQRLFTAAHERDLHVHHRALLEFYSSGFQKTKEHTGVLIFLSLMERMCVVLADDGIARQLPDTTWKNLVDQVVQGIRTGRPAEGLISAIHESGEILGRHFPNTGKHTNQIPNDLIIKD